MRVFRDGVGPAQAAIVENKREDLARDAARLERLEKKMEDHEKLRDSEDAEVTEEQKAEARNYVATNSGVLDDKRADFHRRKESLEKLEKQLADYQALLDEEDREAKERLESARLAKAEFEERQRRETRIVVIIACSITHDITDVIPGYSTKSAGRAMSPSSSASSLDIR